MAATFREHAFLWIQSAEVCINKVNIEINGHFMDNTNNVDFV